VTERTGPPHEPTSRASLVLRLAGPLQSWGSASQFNRRETSGEPTKGGIIGLLAAAQGRRRADPIEDLLDLSLAVRTDQPGTLLRDYHTVSDYRGVPLLSASVRERGKDKGRQTPATAPGPTRFKYTHVTQRFYLQDAVFVAVVAGAPDLLGDLAAALRRPAFPLALGRRACVPTQPLLLRPPAGNAWEPSSPLWAGQPSEVVGHVPWQASPARIQALTRNGLVPARIDLPVVLDDPAGNDQRCDVPRSFNPTERGFRTRRVRHAWAHAPTSTDTTETDAATATVDATGVDTVHDPFALLGW
jgi:CRISPR system Cascade subunit CasD